MTIQSITLASTKYGTVKIQADTLALFDPSNGHHVAVCRVIEMADAALEVFRGARVVAICGERVGR